MSRSAASMDLRRQAMFDKQAIIIKDERVDDERNGHIIHFKLAVYAGRHLVGRTVRRRHALKRAHQWIKDHGK